MAPDFEAYIQVIIFLLQTIKLILSYKLFSLKILMRWSLSHLFMKLFAFFSTALVRISQALIFSLCQATLYLPPLTQIKGFRIRSAKNSKKLPAKELPPPMINTLLATLDTNQRLHNQVIFQKQIMISIYMYSSLMGKQIISLKFKEIIGK